MLRQIKLVSRASIKARLDGIENPHRAGDVALGGANAVLRGEHLEIGVCDAGERRERDDIAIETGRGGGFVGGERSVAVLAPEIDLVAGAERR